MKRARRIPIGRRIWSVVLVIGSVVLLWFATVFHLIGWGTAF